MPENTTYTREEIAQRGEELYRQKIQPTLAPGLDGQFLVLDLVSEDYEIDPRDAEATRRLLVRHPQGVLYGLRIGHKTAYRVL